jgi:hypothetical protein
MLWILLACMPKSSGSFSDGGNKLPAETGSTMVWDFDESTSLPADIDVVEESGRRLPMRLRQALRMC